VVLCGLAADKADRVRRIHDAVSVDPIDFESGVPSCCDARVALEGTAVRTAVERAGGLRCCGA
jgi:hypothetical protein